MNNSTKYIVLFSSGKCEVHESIEAVKDLLLCGDGEFVKNVYKAQELTFKKISDVTFSEAA